MIKNIAASVRQRLLNQSRSQNRPFAEMLQYYAMERFLYRLSNSDHRDKFILKGALMLQVWQSPVTRPTMDIDMLGRTNNDEENILEQVRDILITDVEPDGLIFKINSLKSERITEDTDYEGIRVRFSGNLDTAIIRMQIDIGFNDIVYPEPRKKQMPVILDFPAAKLYCYSRESTIAEKFEAMVKLGQLNSRLKDFYDIWLLSRQFTFDENQLKEAIKLTFTRRGTDIPVEVAAFTPEFIKEKQVHWSAFRKRLKQDTIPESFGDIVSEIENFLSPIVKTII